MNKFINEIKKSNNPKSIILNNILKFSIFGIIALSLGLSYSVRNFIKFGQTLLTVPDPGKNIYCGDKTWSERLNIFSEELFKDTYCHPFEDCNIPAYLIKSSLFGEYNMDKINVNHLLSKILIIINVILSLITLISIIAIIYRYKRIPKRPKVYLNMFMVTFGAQILMYLFSNVSMPYGCTMDFRYIVPTIFTGMMFIIVNMLSYKRNKNSILKFKIIYMLIIIFSLLSIIFEVVYMKYLTI